MTSQSFDQECVEMTPIDDDKKISASFQLNSRDSFSAFARQDFKLRTQNFEQAESNKNKKITEFIASDTPPHHENPNLSPIDYETPTLDLPVVEDFEPPTLFDRSHKFSFINQKIQEHSSRLNLMNSARQQEDRQISQDRQSQEQEDLEDLKQLDSAHKKPQISEIEVMEMTKQFNSLIDVYRPRIDRICNIKKIKIPESEKARSKKDVVKEVEEEQFANSYSMASIIESQLEKQRKFKDRHTDAVKQDGEDSQGSQAEDVEKVENRIWIETKILSFHSTKFHVKIHGKLCTNYTQRSFSRFTLLSNIRQIAIWINEWVWFERAILLVIILNAILFGAKDYSYVATDTSEQPLINAICDKSVIVVAIIYVSEMLIKLLALGLISDKHTYLRDWWNLFDLLMVIASVFSLYPEFVNLSIIKTFKIYRFFMLQQKLPTMRNLIKTLVKSLPQLFHLSVLLIVCQLFYATVGLQIWSGQSHYRCRQTLQPVDGDWKVVDDDFRVCGGLHQCNLTLSQACGSLFDPEIRLNLNLTDDELYRDSTYQKLNFGLTNFDNVINSYITVFQASTLQGWMQILEFSLDGDNQIIASVYFIALVVVIHFLVLKISIGVMIVNCQELHEQENLELIQQIEECGRLIKERHADLQITDFEEKKGNKCTFYCGKAMNMLLTHKASPEPIDKRYDYLFFRLIWRFVQQPSLKILLYLLVVVNLVIISIQTINVQFDGLPDEQPFSYYYEVLLAINFVFLLEICFKLLAFTCKSYFTSSVTIADLLVTLTYFSVFATDCFINGQFSFGGSEMTWTNRLVFLNFLRTLKIFELLRMNSKFKIIIETITSTLKETPNYLVIMFIFVYIFALLGLQVFAGKLTDSSSGMGTPRMNFDNLLWALLSVVQVLMGENWNVLFYDCYKGRGLVISIFYFFPLVTIGVAVMMNLFLVLLLGTYQKQILISQLQNEQTMLVKVGGNFQIASKVPTLNPILIGEEEINGLYGYGEGLPTRVFDGVDSLKLNSPFRSIIKTKPNSLDQTEDNERMSDPPSSHRNLIKLERMSIGSPNFMTRSRHKVQTDGQREQKNDQYDSSLEMEDYIQKYEDFKKKEREDIFKNIKNQIGQKGSECSPFQRQKGPLPFAEALQADKFYQSREPQTALLRSRLESTLFEKQQDKLNLSTRNDENKAGQRRVEIIGGNLFVQDSQSKLGQIANFISKGVAQLKINKVTPEGHKNNVSAKPKSKGVYQELSQNFSWPAMRQFLGNSSLFILHKNSSLRQLLIRIAVGGEKVRTFKTIPDLLQFYSQDAVELKKDYLLQKQQNLNPNLEGDNSEEIIESLFHHTDSADIPSTALNNSHAISELQSLQSDKRFNLAKLEEQAVLINKILEQKKHKSFYNNPSQKQKGVFYLDEKRDINIQWNKWYNFTIYQFCYFIMQMCVVIAILVLILDDPLDDPNGSKKIVLHYVDLAVTFVFIIEAIIKILALGFFKTSLRGGKQRAYLQNFWNVLDFAVLITTILQIYNEKAYFYNLIEPNHESKEDMTTVRNVSILRIFRALRILRPLRMSSHLLGLKIAMNTIISSAIQILNVAIVSFFGLVLFAILGKSLFTQCFYQCLINGDSQIARTDYTINTKQDCLDQGYEWKNASQNFDDMPSALWTLFALFSSTSAGWLDAMYNGVDARGFDLQPKRNNNPWLCLYFVCFMIVSQMLMFNLFVGIVFEKYSRLSDRITSFHNANNQQRAWIDVQRQVMRKQLRKKLFASENACRVLARKVSNNKYFGIFVMTCIVLNSVVLAIPYLGMSSQFSEILNSIVIGFTVVYNIEAAIKIIGLGRHYFYSRWNQFDFTIVLLADITYLVERLIVNISLSKFVVVMRALRTLRVIRVLREHRQAMIYVNAIMAIVGFFINILIILFIILLIFSVLGMGLYKSVMLQDQYNESYNFRSFGSSFLLLIGCLTGQNWNLLMDELSLQGSYNGVQCVQNQTYEDWQVNGVIGCGFSNAYYFFFFYIMITRFLIVNLMTGFVIYGFISANRENHGIIKPEDIEFFIKLWADYDHKATGWIEVVDVVFLIYELPAPLGKADDYKEQQQQSFAFLEDEKRVSNVLPNKTRFVVKKEKNMVLSAKITIQEMKNLNVKVYNDPNGGVKCHFKDICIALMTRALNKTGNQKHQAQLDKVTSAAFQSHFGNLQENAVIKNETAGSYLAGIFLGRLIKGVFQRKNRHRVNQMPSIGVYNTKAEYSRKLRELEITRAQQKREKQDNEQKRQRASSISKFETEMGLINHSPQTPVTMQEQKALDQPLSSIQKKVKFSKDNSPSIYPGYPLKKSIRNDSNFFNQGCKLKDTERSLWWLPETHVESTAAKLQNWIAQQDFCHGHHDQSDASDSSKVPKQQNQDINENNDDEHKNSWDQSVFVEEFNEIQTKQFNLEVPPMRRRSNVDIAEQRQLQHYGKQDLDAGEEPLKQSTLFKTKILLNKVQPAQTEKIEEIKEGSDTNSFITDSSIEFY